MQITKVIILLSALCLNAIACTAYGAVADDIARYFPEQQITQLTVLDKQIPAVTLSSRHPLSRGVAIVLVDAESQSLNLDGGLILADTLTERVALESGAGDFTMILGRSAVSEHLGGPLGACWWAIRGDLKVYCSKPAMADTLTERVALES